METRGRSPLLVPYLFLRSLIGKAAVSGTAELRFESLRRSHIELSSNGRTQVFGTCYQGSNPCSSANRHYSPKYRTVFKCGGHEPYYDKGIEDLMTRCSVRCTALIMTETVVMLV